MKLSYIAAWLHQHSDLIITGLIAFVSSTIVNVFLAPYVSQRFRRSAEKRDEHLAELKRDVLQPMLDHLCSHILPVLELRRGNVGMRRRIVRQRVARVMEDSTTFVDELCFQEAAEPPIDLLKYPNDEEQPGDRSLESPLYMDARLHHFSKCFRAWNDLLAAVRAYHSDCVNHVERLRQEIAQSCSLPEYDGALRQSGWVNAMALALIIFYRQIGLRTSQFSESSEVPATRLVYETAHTLVQGPSGEIARCVSKLDQLLTRRNEVEQLVKEADSVRRDSLKMQKEIEHLLLIRRLPGRCSFLAN